MASVADTLKKLQSVRIMPRSYEDLMLTEILNRFFHIGKANTSTGLSNLVNTTDNRSLISILDDFKDQLNAHDVTSNIVLTTVYVPVFVMALIGNALILTIVLSNASMKTMTNLLLFNLAVADLSGRKLNVFFVDILGQ